MTLLIGFLLVVHVVVCLLMCVTVLMQVPASQGLGAAFGGGMTENVFGAQTTNVLAKATVWLGIGFFVITLSLAMAYAHSQPTGAKIEQELLSTPVESPEASATPAVDDAAEAPAPPAVDDAPEISTTPAGDDAAKASKDSPEEAAREPSVP